MSNNQKKKSLYPLKDTLQVILGIPIVATVAVFCASYVTSYAGI